MEQEKPLSSILYGMIGVAAVGAISLVLLAIVVFGTTPTTVQLTSF